METRPVQTAGMGIVVAREEGYVIVPSPHLARFVGAEARPGAPGFYVVAQRPSAPVRTYGPFPDAVVAEKIRTSAVYLEQKR